MQCSKGRSHDSCCSWICHLCLCTGALFWHLSDLGGKQPSSQHVQRNSVNFCISAKPPALKTLGGMPSGPADLPHCNSSIASLSSSSVVGSSSSICRSLAGISSITLGSIDKELLRSCLKCSDYLLFIAPLSVRSSPYRLRIGAALLWGGPHTSLKLE